MNLLTSENQLIRLTSLLISNALFCLLFIKIGEIMNKTTLKHLEKVIEYLYLEEYKHYQASDNSSKKNHIFNSIKYIDQNIKKGE